MHRTQVLFHSDVDRSPIEVVIMINENENKTTSSEPNSITVRVGSEILIANNSTSDQSVTSGSGPDDAMYAKQFDTDLIKRNGFTEYVTNNLSPGNYSFYSSADPEIKGQVDSDSLTGNKIDSHSPPFCFVGSRLSQ